MELFLETEDFKIHPSKNQSINQLFVHLLLIKKETEAAFFGYCLLTRPHEKIRRILIEGN